MHNPLTSHLQASTLENMHLINGWSAKSAMNLLILKPQGLVVACDAIFAWETRDGTPESWRQKCHSHRGWKCKLHDCHGEA